MSGAPGSLISRRGRLVPNLAVSLLRQLSPLTSEFLILGF
jgi:hypothetical protein